MAQRPDQERPPEVHPFTLLSDEPYYAGPDPLGFDDVARDLAQLLLRSADATPLTLGIEGGWGMGKSSLMHRLDAHLRNEQVKTVWFNAWAVGSGSGLEGLVKTVLNEIDPNVLRRALRHRNVMTGLRLALTVAAAWLRLGVLVDAVWREFGLDPHARNELGVLVVQAMEAWLKQRPSIPSGQILAVFVDDLDRCAPAAVLEIFEAIRLYLGARGFVFVLGYDRNIVSRSILQSQHYDASVTVREYLEKIVQISYRIEPPGEGEADRLIEQYLERSRTIDLFQDADRRLILQRNARNPRRVKRFINNVVLEYPLDPDWKRLGPASLVTVLILQYYWPDFLRLLSDDSEADIATEFVQYVDARRIIRRGTQRDSPDWRLVADAFQSADLAVPSPDESPNALVQDLDEARPAYRQLAQEETLVAIVRGLAATESRPLLEKLRRRPLPAPPEADETTLPEQPPVPAPVEHSPEPTPDRIFAAVPRHRGAAQAPVKIPPASGPPPYRLELGAVLAPAQVTAIQRRGRVVFHTMGSVGGVQNPLHQAAVAAAMTEELTALDPAPSFLYLLGDLVYFYGETDNYYAQFYEPYAPYGRPIFAIPGNHDGAAVDSTSDAPLTGFLRNFCAASGTRRPEAGDVDRKAMIQPNVYWTLRAPFVTVVGLFTNVPEGGHVDEEQARWLAAELRDAPRDRAVIVAMHHAVYSFDTSRGSSALGAVLDAAAASAGRAPDLVLAGHVMNYQRFSRRAPGRVTAYVIAGAGGYRNLRRMAVIDGQRPAVPLEAHGGEVALLAFHDSSHGFLRVEVSAETLEGTYMALGDRSTPPAQAVDRFSIAL